MSNSTTLPALPPGAKFSMKVSGRKARQSHSAREDVIWILDRNIEASMDDTPLIAHASKCWVVAGETSSIAAKVASLGLKPGEARVFLRYKTETVLIMPDNAAYLDCASDASEDIVACLQWLKALVATGKHDAALEALRQKHLARGK